MILGPLKKRKGSKQFPVRAHGCSWHPQLRRLKGHSSYSLPRFLNFPPDRATVHSNGTDTMESLEAISHWRIKALQLMPQWTSTSSDWWAAFGWMSKAQQGTSGHSSLVSYKGPLKRFFGCVLLWEAPRWDDKSIHSGKRKKPGIHGLSNAVSAVQGSEQH